MFRQLLSKVFLPNLDKDLARNVRREVAKMDPNLNFAPSVYGYCPRASSVTGGAFGGSTSSLMRQVVLTRVDIPFKANLGMFH
ncbi:hypothetical protein ACHAXA_007434 [Cyclostephanos tholiformis]|uniref:Uncharacterized protein n=1 Tax=Cyclostephanos tholiformis TaxID=382380 RepID=A0ABD3SDM8_9STRA